jgi:Na+-driven multidrug efflux pump
MVQLLFRNAAIDLRTTLAIASIQRVFAFQLPFLLVGIVYSRIIASFCETRKLLYISTMVLGLDIVFDALLSRWFGAIGIAASTVICYAASMLVAQRIVSRLLFFQTARRAAEAA